MMTLVLLFSESVRLGLRQQDLLDGIDEGRLLAGAPTEI
jgi:hypothetical protein